MIQTIKDIDLEVLKTNYARLYYFGLGFIQLKINDIERLHFYSSKLPAITEDPHNHRYGYLSRVLKGSLTNHIHKQHTSTVYNGDSLHLIVNESCNPDIKAPALEEPCWDSVAKSETYTVGQSYVMLPETFHHVEAKDCITYLIRTHKTAEFAKVILPRGKTNVCPFSKKIPEPELWDIMKEMVNER